jgi:hypothetical protein
MTTPCPKRNGFTIPNVAAILILILVVLGFASLLYVIKTKDDVATKEPAAKPIEEPAEKPVDEKAEKLAEELTAEREKLKAAIEDIENFKADMIVQAERTAIDAGIAELNSREALAWGQAKLADVDIEADGITIDRNLGADYSFDGTNLTFGSTTVKLTYVGPSESAPGVWSR